MDRHARLGADSQDETMLDADHSPDAMAATAKVVTRLIGKVSVSIEWVSTRSEYWPPPRGREPFLGVACLQFGIEADGVGWLARLARSSWFAGLEPRAEDLAVSGGVPCGRWALPDGCVAGTGTDVAEAEAFFVSEPLPKAWLAVVAVPRGAGLAEQAAALGLVSALRTRRDPGGRALGVVVTVEAVPSEEADAFVRSLLARGAFVVRGGAGQGTGATGDFLHHFPLRALTEPREGRLVCVDFADFMRVWRPGRAADLHVVPFAGGDAAAALQGVSLPDEGSVRALTIGFHLDPDAPDQGLVEVDRFATVCCELFPTPDGDVVFTTMDRLDGVTGSVDVLVIHDSAEASG
ncbi:MAG: hypothetical protein ACRYHQ_08910 [Janthinobacterium lividum]